MQLMTMSEFSGCIKKGKKCTKTKDCLLFVIACYCYCMHVTSKHEVQNNFFMTNHRKDNSTHKNSRKHICILVVLKRKLDFLIAFITSDKESL